MAYTEWEILRTAVGQNSIKIILCDDNPYILTKVQDEIERIFTKLNMTAGIRPFDRPADIPEDLLADCDMAFFDIDFENEEQNGIDIARALRQVNDHALVFFVTNFIEYAPAGYEVQAFRYILKRDMGEVLERYLMQAMEQLAEDREYLCLRDRVETAELPLDEIVYLEVIDHEVSVHSENALHSVHATLSGLEKQLENRGFLRIHKSYLVNMRFIRKFRSRECLLSDGTTLAVSEKNYAHQKQKYLLWKGLT